MIEFAKLFLLVFLANLVLVPTVAVLAQKIGLLPMAPAIGIRYQNLFVGWVHLPALAKVLRGIVAANFTLMTLVGMFSQISDDGHLSSPLDEALVLAVSAAIGVLLTIEISHNSETGPNA